MVGWHRQVWVGLHWHLPAPSMWGSSGPLCRNKMSFEVPPQPRCSLSCPCPWLSSAPVQLLVRGLPECVGTRTPSPGSSLSARVAVPPEDFRILCYGFILGLGFCFHVPGQDKKGTTGEGSVEGSEGESRHRGCGVSFPGDDQNPPGFDPAQPARGNQLWQGLE